MGKLLISHRSTIYPCFLPDLGEFNRSWSYKTYPWQKYENFIPMHLRLLNFSRNLSLGFTLCDALPILFSIVLLSSLFAIAILVTNWLPFF